MILEKTIEEIEENFNGFITTMNLLGHRKFSTSVESNTKHIEPSIQTFYLIYHYQTKKLIDALRIKIERDKENIEVIIFPEILNNSQDVIYPLKNKYLHNIDNFTYYNKVSFLLKDYNHFKEFQAELMKILYQLT